MNAMYSIYCRGTRPVIELKGTVRVFKTKVKQWVSQPPFDISTGIHLHVDFLQPWYYANGQLKRQDVPNLLKVVLDALAERWGVDDSCFLSVSCRKVEARAPAMHITVRTRTLEGAEARVLDAPPRQQLQSQAGVGGDPKAAL